LESLLPKGAAFHPMATPAPIHLQRRAKASAMSMMQAGSTAQDAEVAASGPPRVVVAVLTWNGYELARASLESLTTLDSWPLPVIVVDNGSETDEGDRLAREFGAPISSVRLDPNRGAAETSS
jgi:hypothetical protein